MRYYSPRYYSSNLRKPRRKFLSDEKLLVVAVGLVVGALGIWFIVH